MPDSTDQLSDNKGKEGGRLALGGQPLIHICTYNTMPQPNILPVAVGIADDRCPFRWQDQQASKQALQRTHTQYRWPFERLSVTLWCFMPK